MNADRENQNPGRGDRASRWHRAACLLAALMMLMILVPLPTTADPVEDDRHNIVIEKTYSWPVLTQDEYDQFNVDGLSLSRMNDAPYGLPVDPVEISIPAGTVSDIRIDYTTTDELFLGIYSLKQKSISNGLDTVPYGSGDQKTEYLNENGFYYRSGGSVLYLLLSPISYDPQTGATYFVEKITVTVSYILEEAPTTYRMTAAGDDLLIITSDVMIGEFQRYADWKSSLGFNVMLVNVSTAVGGGAVTAQAIKSYINAQHNISSIEYVLLGGDDTVIPAWHVEITLPIPQPHPTVISDLYYASFNYDIDWSTEISPFYNLSIGRLPFNTVGQLSNYIDKLIRYEGRDYADYYNEVLFLGQQLNPDPLTWGGDGKDTNLIYVPSEYNVTTLYERDMNYPTEYVGFTKVHDALENGTHIVNDLSHGDFNYLMGLTTTNMVQVDNPLPYIWFSQACRIGGFDKNPNIGKSLLADENNAIALVAHSREGLYEEGDAPSGPSNIFDNAYMSLLFNDTLLLGDVVRLSKESLAGTISDVWMLWIYTELNLLGDPTLKVGGYDTLPSSSLQINDNAELMDVAALRGWSGNGTSDNPYIIEGYHLRNSDYSECLYIGNTTLYVVIRDNNIVQAISGQNGIVLNNVTNVLVQGNSFSDKNTGLLIIDSQSVQVEYNDFSSNQVGILLDGCQGVVLEGNNFTSNQIGIRLDGCQGALVEGNHLVIDNVQGIVVMNDDASELQSNIISRSDSWGIYVNGTGTLIFNNTLVFNNGGIGSTDPQAYNEGTNSWSNNFWYLFSGVEYNLSGSGSDSTPLSVDPNDAPQFNTAALDSLQNDEVTVFTTFDFTATSVYGMDSYLRSVNGGAWTVTGPNISAGSLGFTTGLNEINVMAFSSAGNAQNYSLTVNYTTAGVSVNITAPTAYYLNTDRVAVRWTTSDALNLSHYEVRVDNGDWLNVSSTTRYTTPSLSEGLHVISVRAMGYDGGVAVDNRSVFVDTVTPSVFIVNLLEGQIITDNQIFINWTVSDASPSSGISHFTIQIDSSTVITIENSSTRSYTMPLSEGSHRITLRAYDNAGNYRQAQVNVVVDSQPPLIVFTIPADYPYYASNLQVNWTVTDSGSGVASTHIRINRGAWIDVTGLSTYTFLGLSDGYYAIEIKSLDRAGHLSDAYLGTVVAQNQAVLDFINPHSGGYSKSPDIISWNVWDKRGYTYTYSYSLDGAAFVNLGSTSQVNLTMANGAHTMVVKAVCVQTGATMQRSTSFIALQSAQPPSWTNPEQAESEFLFDLPLSAGFDLVMLVDKGLTTMVLTDSEGSEVPGTTVWSSGGVMTFYPSGNLDYPAQYLLSITVVDVAGNVLVFPVPFSTKEVSLPGAPQNLTISYQPSWDGVSMSLTWGEPTDDGGYPAEVSPLQYNVYRRTNTSDFTLLATVTDLSYEDSSVNWNDYFIYYVTAENPVGEGPASELVFSALPEEPDLLAKIGLFLDYAGEIIDMFLADAGTYLDMIGDQLGGYIDMIVAAVSEFLDSLATAIIDGINSFVDGLIDVLNQLGDAIIVFLEALGQFLGDVANGLANTHPQDLLALFFIIFLLGILAMLLKMDHNRRRSIPKAEEPKVRYPLEKKVEDKVLDLVIPRSINATITEQNGRLIMEEINELESAYQEGLVGWQDYEMTLAELSASLSAITLASYFAQVSEDTY